MIAAQLNGGLGNQLFQYATARALAEKNNTLPYLDLTLLLQPEAKQEFYLSRFNIRAQTNSNYLKRWWFHNVVKQKLQVVQEDPSVQNIFPSDSIFLKGYWQDRNYFDNIKQVLIREIDAPVDSPYLSQIKKQESVAVHIRRGDYVGNPLHEVCTEKYFQHAIDFVKSKLNDPLFFVFTDDLEYGRHIRQQQANIILVEEEDTVTSFCLMKSCTHFILSNSSFSWWAQYLNTKENIVTAPPRWFNDAGIHTSGIYFDHWKIIETA